MEDEGGREEFFEQVDFREGVVEASIGVAEEGSGGFGEELGRCFHVEDDCGVPVCQWPLSEDIFNELKNEVPIWFYFTLIIWRMLSFALQPIILHVTSAVGSLCLLCT